MSVATQLARDWETTTGRKAAHSARVNRALQMCGMSPIGIQGKAAYLNTTALTYFLLADVSGDGISTAAERAKEWSGLVCDRSSPTISGTESKAAKIFRAWADDVRAAAGSVDAQAQHDILPGIDLGTGIVPLLDRMSDDSFNIPFGDLMVPFTQIVSHLGFKIELLMGGNEGPQAIVHCGLRHNRYSAKVQPSEKLRNARWPVESRVTIEIGHLVTLARLCADARARTNSVQPVPPSGPASPAVSEKENAGPSGEGPTFSRYQPHDDTRTNADTTRKDQASGSPDPIARVYVPSRGIEPEAGLTTSNLWRRAHDPASHHHALLEATPTHG